jgi:uncharacterized membrane protein
VDEKTTRAIRAKIYIAFAIVSLILVFVFSGTVQRVAMGILAVYCVVMAVVNFRKAKDEGDDRS